MFLMRVCAVVLYQSRCLGTFALRWDSVLGYLRNLLAYGSEWFLSVSGVRRKKKSQWTIKSLIREMNRFLVSVLHNLTGATKKWKKGKLFKLSELSSLWRQTFYSVCHHFRRFPIITYVSKSPCECIWVPYMSIGILLCYICAFINVRGSGYICACVFMCSLKQRLIRRPY